MWILAKSEAIQVRPPFVKISLMIGVRTYFFTFTFALYREKKLSEGKSAAVARSHVAKKTCSYHPFAHDSFDRLF